MKNFLEKLYNTLKPLFLACKKNQFRAKLISPNFLFCLMLALFALRIVFFPFYFCFPKSAFFAKIISSDITNLLNKERSSLGLNELVWNAELAYAAKLKAQDMLERDYFAHTSPSGEKGWSFIEKAGYNYKAAGENLAIGFLDSSEVHQAWNESPSHKQNLVSPYFKEVGVSALTGDFEGRATTVVVQFFGSPADPLSIAAAPAQTQDAIPNALTNEVEANQLLTQAETPQQLPEVVGKTDQNEIVSLPASLEFNLFNFVANKYNPIIEKIILLTAGALAFILCLNILVLIFQPIENRLKWIMIRNTALTGIFSIFMFIFIASIDKSVFLRAIPHNIKI